MERWILRILAIMGLVVAGCFWVSIAGVKEPAPRGLRMVWKMEDEDPKNDKLTEAGKELEIDIYDLRDERNQAKWIAIVTLGVLGVGNLLIAKRLPKRAKMQKSDAT